MEPFVAHASVTPNKGGELKKIKIEVTVEDSNGVGRVETLRGVAALIFVRMPDGNHASMVQGALGESTKLLAAMPDMLTQTMDVMEKKIDQIMPDHEGVQCRCPHGHH